VLDGAVLDINLNGVESYPVADELAARNVPFVFSTNYGKKSLHNGYSSFPLLQKPFSLQEISDAIAELLAPKERVVSTK
jgi:CheY-like chemotaxis protein